MGQVNNHLTKNGRRIIVRKKRPRKFTRAEKLYLSSIRLNCNNWLFVSADDQYWHIKNREKGHIKKVSAPTK
ncbi:DUF6906 family protein [Lysinibacillus capsici]|uniref:DUF6906 family protein n=1 Tax=Lysinibacillus capsici TaxID=2115968 RepID=UPI003D7F7523